MADDITKNISYNYRTNVQTLTRHHDTFDQRLRKLTRTTQVLTRAIGSKDRYMLRSERVTQRNIATNKRFSAGMRGLAMRFVGYQAILSMVMRAQQQLTEWVKKSITEFRAFEMRVAEISTILGDNASMTLVAAASIEHLSKQFGQAVTDLSRGYYDIVSAAFGAEEGIYLLNVATEASIAGITNVSTAVDSLTSVLNAYGMSAAQSAEISDMMFQTVRYGKLRFEDLASAMGYITPIAASAGVEFKEILATLSTVTRMGLHTDMAVRGLALTIQNIVSPTEQASKAAMKYGVDMSGLALRVKGLKGFMVDLNAAVKEHGTRIIPEMIGNMRSLRVVMALVGEEGIQGFTRDLNYMNNATGQAEIAMTKMMQTAQMQAQIMTQSLEYAERRVGEAWSGFELWWKKAQVWWGTLISGGDADRAVQNIDDRLKELSVTSAKLVLKQIDLSKNTKIDPENIKSFLDMSKEMTKLADMASLSAAKSTILKVATEKLNIPVEALTKTNSDAFNSIKLTKKEIEGLTLAFQEAGMEWDGSIKTLGDVVNVVNSLDTVFASSTEQVENNREAFTNLLATSQEYKAAWDDASQSIQNHKINLLELQNAILQLDVEVRKSYIPRLLGGEGYAGTLGLKKAITEFQMFTDRFKKFTGMTVKYGDAFEGMEWFEETQQDIFNLIAANSDYDGSIEDIISTMANYNQIVKENKKLQKELTDALDENTRKMRENSLEIMKIQLKGMMRRRGLSRSEEKAIKKLNIKNMEIRIDSMQKTVEVEKDLYDESIDHMETAYDTASSILEEFFDKVQHHGWMLADVREDDLANLDEIIDMKEIKLKAYEEWLGEEIIALEGEWDTYYNNMLELSNKMPDVFSDIFGEDAIAKFFKDIETLKELTGLEIEAPARATGVGAQAITRTPEETRAIYEGRHARLFGNFQRGIYRVPETMPAIVHRGEQIVPAGGQGGAGGNVTIYNEVHAVINNEMDARQLAELLAEGERNTLLKRGKTTVRVR